MTMVLKPKTNKLNIIIIDDDSKSIEEPKKYKMRRPIPTPRKSVKDIVKDYEEIIILPPIQFRDGYKTYS